MTDPGLSISQLAQRTGLAPPTLRMWESRYGFPEPYRLPSGHRRYAAADVERVREVVRRRNGGLSLVAAIRRVDEAAPDPESIYAALRQGQPDVAPQRVRKRELVTLSRAIEDECCARAPQGMLVGAFQRERFYRRVEPRWRDMARTARLAVVFADFPGVRRPDPGPVEVPVAADRPLQREWVLLHDSPRHSVGLAGWELPGQDAVPDTLRVFESIWTVGAPAVAAGLAQAASLAGRQDETLGAALAGQVDRERPASAPEVALATSITARMLAYAAEAAD